MSPTLDYLRKILESEIDLPLEAERHISALLDIATSEITRRSLPH